MRNMELQRRIEMGFQISKAYIFLTLNEVALAVFLVLVESLASSGISTLIIVVYEHVLATIVLSLLSFFFEKYVFSTPFLHSSFFFSFLVVIDIQEKPINFFLHLFTLHYNIIVFCFHGDSNMIPFLCLAQFLTIGSGLPNRKPTINPTFGIFSLKGELSIVFNQSLGFN